ncbi:GNAT family N-acetyltransferase [Nocardioides solisilvae]|uniref:GNAT family N-acetyltransferase n=1 Tax=Nocardioides solisilvae TaxID=1542435 RepID=UPI001EF52ED7|nr:GNAT family N-acetyltransferase [Nocardioides solisilvae]
MTTLALPSPDRYDAWLACVRDFGDGPTDGSGAWMLPELRPDRASFDALLAATAAEADTAVPPPQGKVHSDYWWVTEGSAVVGFLAVRHALNDFLLRQGGHIGYSIAPSYRRRGHATRALALGVARARELGIARVLVTCSEDNVASARTIERNGGVFEDVREGKRRYWIEA